MKMKSLATVAAESTCLKRVTVCTILDRAGDVISMESNRCNPPNGQCARLGLSQDKPDYSTQCTCNWEHAEVRAIAALDKDAVPSRAIVCGHEFCCPACEKALNGIGITDIEVVPDAPCTGVRRR